MSDFFRLKIGAKRQVTLPQLLLNRLSLKEGDELEFEITDEKIQTVRALKLVPLEYFDSKTLAVLKQRAAQIDRPAYVPPVLQEEEETQGVRKSVG